MADKNSGWRKYFKAAHVGGDLSPISGKNQYGLPGFNRQTGGGQGLATGNDFAFRNYASRLPEVYSGHPNRIERYNQYENMDMDSEVNACLDILSEFSTQLNEENQTPFEIQFKDDPTDNELDIIRKQLQQWTKINKFEQRIFKLFRNTIKYGDQVFIRDPETFELMWVDMVKVSRIIVNESEGKRPEQYVIRDINPNFQNMSISQKTTQDYYVSRATGSVGQTNYTYPNGGAGAGAGGGTGNARFTQAMNETCIDARHVVHLSLNEGLDYFWPFGQSILENIFKVYKQKELLEDSVLIYRVARAPERRVFKIDVGNMPSHLAMQFVERVKNEMHQRRIPTVTGGGANMMDTSYNPLSINEDYFFPQTAEGRGSSVETLPGGCLAMDTLVPLLDGRTLTIAEISDELAEDKTLWAYSCHPRTGKVVPGLISWAGMTQKSAQVMRITLDNGETIVCTPCHKFPQYDGDFKRADELAVDDSLIPLYRRAEQMAGKKRDYEQFLDNASKEWKFTHRMVADTFKDSLCEYRIYDEFCSNGLYEVRHHVDCNRHNNAPENLVWMSWHDHQKLHQDLSFSREASLLGTEAARLRLVDMKENDPDAYAEYCAEISRRHREWWASLTDAELREIGRKQSKAIKEHINSLTEEEREERDERSRTAFKIASEKKLARMAEDSEYRDWICKRQSEGWNEEMREERSKWATEMNLEQWKDNDERRQAMSNLQSVTYSHDMLRRVIDLVHGKTSHEFTLNDVLNELNNDAELLEELYQLNKDKKVRNWTINRGFTATGMVSLVRQFGYASWSDFRRKESVHNHRIIAIEYLDERIPVGTLTIDSDEKYHNYHTFALKAGIFTKNSNLGEIDDLKYFNNKMARGLRVPSSYLPTGPDDSSVAMNDGKVGTALIQEYRFNQYCKRLQNLIVQKLDDEFKLFLKWRGLSIDSGMFNITFAPPQNFAAYRQSELDTTRIAAFTQLDQFPYFAKRFLMERFLGLTLEEIHRNEELWQEEREEPAENQAKGSDLRTVGVTPGGMTTDTEAGEAFGADMAGAEAPAPDLGGGMPEMPAAAPPPPTAPPV